MGRSWYEIRNAAEPEAEIYIYDEIGYWGISASDFVKELTSVSAPVINLHLNSPGGEVFDGIAIYNSLKQHHATINITVDGIAASTASFIAQAGDHIVMAKAASMMIHEPYGMAMGNSETMEKMAEELGKIGDTIASIYAERAGGTEEEWRARMLEESWYRDQEAVDAGLADEVMASKPKASAMAGRAFNLSKFKNVPEWLQDHAAADSHPDGDADAPPAAGPDDLPDIDIAEHVKWGVARVMEPDSLPEFDLVGAVREGTR